MGARFFLIGRDRRKRMMGVLSGTEKGAITVFLTRNVLFDTGLMVHEE
jgi:hypothetical protein